MFYISETLEDTQMKHRTSIDTDSKNICNGDSEQIVEDITDKISPKKRSKKKSE